MVIGENPCGWCGLEGCKTHLIYKKRRKNPIISSNCSYHYDKLIYSKASVSGKTAACTNIPIPCPICPKGRNDQSPVFWKYNLISHMTENHMVDEQLPPFPPELRKSAYISRAKENRMGVELVATIKFRKTYGLDVYSDPIEIPTDIESDDEGSETMYSRGRKCAFSLLSQTSSNTRQQPQSKVVQM